MNRTTLISEMQKFRFGSKVFCSDGEEGTLSHVSFDPASRRMTHIGVKQGRFFGKTVYLPFDAVENATGEGVTVRITRAELAASKTQPRGALLDAKSSVEREGGGGAANRGTLLLTAVQPESGELAYIVVHHLRPGLDTLLLPQFVTKLEAGRILVSIPDATFQTLPPYRPDSELQQEVENILFDLTPLHVDFKGMKVRVLDGVLYLDGNMSSSLRGDIVRDQALGVQGLLEIRNQLVGDDKLAGDLAMALGRDERTRDLPIGVYPRLGIVRLSGAVHTQQQKEAAEEITRQFPGVRSVINDLIVDPKAGMLRVMAAPEGGESIDKVPGKYIRHTK
jgi:osmotically-inducible protein OsmY